LKNNIAQLQFASSLQSEHIYDFHLIDDKQMENSHRLGTLCLEGTNEGSEQIHGWFYSLA